MFRSHCNSDWLGRILLIVVVLIACHEIFVKCRIIYLREPTQRSFQLELAVLALLLGGRDMRFFMRVCV